MYFQICSNSTYPQHLGEQYRTSGPLVITIIIIIQMQRSLIQLKAYITEVRSSVRNTDKDTCVRSVLVKNMIILASDINKWTFT